MKTESDCGCCDPRVAAVALGRWCLGIVFLFFGIGKIAGEGGVSGFTQYLASQFQKTWLPSWLVSCFGCFQPYAEVVLGALLVLGLWRNVVLFITALDLLALTFGQVLLQQPAVVFNNTGYTFLAALVLFGARFDRWVLFPRPLKPEEPPKPQS